MRADECLTDAIIVALADGSLDDSARASAVAHLDACATCSMLVAHATRLASAEHKLLDRYVVHGELGSGGMGRVLRAFDLRLGRAVALKILLVDDVRDAARRLQREARALAALNHPSVVTVFDVHRLGHEVFVAMELVEGVTLRTWLAAGQPIDAIMAAFCAAGRGLQAAHAAGLVHRDFKPANVMMGSDGRVVVVDFGLARPGPDRATPLESDVLPLSPPWDRTASQLAAGTPLYMAPEQYRGVADARADQYQFCLALLEASTQRWPFATRAARELAEAKDAQRFLPDAFTGLPRGLERVLRRGLSADPDRRWPDMHTVVQRLESPRRSVAAVVLLGALGLLTAWLASAPTADEAACDDRLDAIWDDARRRAVHDAFAATDVDAAADVAARLSARLDARATAWLDAYDAACKQPDADAKQHDATMRCLERSRDELSAIVDAFTEVTAEEVTRARTTAAELPTAEHCLDADFVALSSTRPTDPAVAADVERLEQELDVARAQIVAGRYEAAEVQLASIVERARPLGHEPLVTQALASRTHCLRALDRTDDAVALGEEAYVAARMLGDDRLAWKIASDVATALRRRGEHAHAERWLLDNEELVLGLDDPKVEAAYESSVGVLRLDARDVSAALDHIVAAVELLEQADPGSLDHGIAVRRLGSALRVVDRVDDGIEQLERSREIIVAAAGAEHPEVRIVEFEIGAAELAAQRYEAAIGPLERACAMIIDALGPRSLGAIEARGALADAYVGARRLEDGEATLVQVVADAEAAGVSPRVWALLQRNLGKIHEFRGDRAAAARSYAEARRIAEGIEAAPIRAKVIESIDAYAAEVDASLGE